MHSSSIPKRTRVAWACSNCRRRKARCDGEKPCQPCKNSQLECVYKAGGRLTTTEYIRQLEEKVGRLESMLRRSDAPSSSTAATTGSSKDAARSPVKTESSDISQQETGFPLSDSEAEDEYLETIITDDPAEIDVPSGSVHSTHEVGNAGFGGLDLLRRVERLCRHVARRSPAREEDGLANAFEVAPPESSTSTLWDIFALLPSRPTMNRAIDIVVDEACSNMQFLDRAMLNAYADEVFQAIEDESDRYDKKRVGLLYAVLAVSRQFSHTPSPTSANRNMQPPASNGLRYFRAARALLDPAMCHDMDSLRTLMCMILYTCAGSMLSACYSYVCMAVAAALRMGLHTTMGDQGLPEEERASRRALFSVLNIADANITSALGLPRTLRDVQPDRALPCVEPPADPTHPLFGTYLHAQLAQILASTVDSIHPFTKPIELKDGFYGVEHSKVVALESKLETWYEQLLQTPLDNSNHSYLPPFILRSQLLLRLYHARVQMVLYRPFLHHALRRRRPTGNLSMKAYACGSANIKAAMQILWLAETLESYNLFNPSQWFVPFIIIFAASCLALFASSNQGEPTVDEVAEAVRRIKDLCGRHADENESLKRCMKFLETISANEESDEQFSHLWQNAQMQESHFDDAFRMMGVESEGGTVEGEGEEMLQAFDAPKLRPILNPRF